MLLLGLLACACARLPYLTACLLLPCSRSHSRSRSLLPFPPRPRPIPLANNRPARIDQHPLLTTLLVDSLHSYFTPTSPSPSLYHHTEPFQYYFHATSSHTFHIPLRTTRRRCSPTSRPGRTLPSPRSRSRYPGARYSCWCRTDYAAGCGPN